MHLEGRALYDAQSLAFLDAFLDLWLALPRAEAGTAERLAAE